MTKSSTPIDLRATEEYRELGYKIVHCPVCGKETLDSYWICQHCGWEYDGITQEGAFSTCNQAMVADYRKTVLLNKNRPGAS